MSKATPLYLASVLALAASVPAVASETAHNSDATLVIDSLAQWQALWQQPAGQPVVLDMYADWCSSCVRIKQEVLPQAQVQQALQPYTLVVADLTAMETEQTELFDSLELIGLPTLLFFDAQGQEVRAARMAQEPSAEQLILHLQEVQQYLQSQP